MSGGRRLLLVITEDWYLVSHRLYLARAAVEAGYEVGVLTRVSTFRASVESAGVKVFDWTIHRRSANPLRELATLWSMWRTFRSFRPDIVHAVALKPIVYSWLIAVGTGVRRRVFALAGLGHIFAPTSRTALSALRSVVLLVFRAAFSGSKTRVVVQNPDDAGTLLQRSVVQRTALRIVRGSGVDTVAFSPKLASDEPPLVVLPGRMLWDKGVAEFVKAAHAVRAAGEKSVFALVGEPDPHNPLCVPLSQLKEWNANGDVEWWGRRSDMPDVLSRAAIVCLPSYHEGLPKALLEAASVGRPIVAFDIPGCREIVKVGLNGVLVPLRDQDALNDALLQLLRDTSLRQRMGTEGRRLVLAKFSQEQIARETLAIWSELF